MKILVMTNVFPSSQHPSRGMHIKDEVGELAKLCDVKVVASLPWFPLLNRFSQTPKKAKQNGIEVFFPKYLTIPKIGRALYGILYFLSVFRTIASIHQTFKFDLILSFWAYPDGFAALLFSKIYGGKPVIIRPRGSDINLMTNNPIVRKLITFTLIHAGKICPVCDDLKIKIEQLGILENKIKVVPCGIDTKKFLPQKKEVARRKLGLPVDKRIILFVGSLDPVKGLPYLLYAVEELSTKRKREDIRLIIIGAGEQEPYLQSEVDRLNLREMVKFVGSKPHDEIPWWMNASDLFCLPSMSEGWPNVIMEALACGKPVVATKVGGVGEMVAPEFGILVPPKDSITLADAIVEALERNWDTTKITEFANNYSWNKIALDVFAEAKLLNSQAP